VNKIAPKFVTLVATYIYVVRLFKDLHSVTYIYVVRRLRVNMILSCTSLFVFCSYTGICGANVQAFDPYRCLCVADCYICWHFIWATEEGTCRRGGISSLHLEFLKAFCICLLFTHKRSALRTKMAAWCC